MLKIFRIKTHGIIAFNFLRQAACTIIIFALNRRNVSVRRENGLIADLGYSVLWN